MKSLLKFAVYFFVFVLLVSILALVAKMTWGMLFWFPQPSYEAVFIGCFIVCLLGLLYDFGEIVEKADRESKDAAAEQETVASDERDPQTEWAEQTVKGTGRQRNPSAEEADAWKKVWRQPWFSRPATDFENEVEAAVRSGAYGTWPNYGQETDPAKVSFTDPLSNMAEQDANSGMRTAEDDPRPASEVVPDGYEELRLFIQREQSK